MGYWICNVSLRRINFKIEIYTVRKLLKVIAALILNEYFQNFKGAEYLMLGGSFVVEYVNGFGSTEKCCLAIMDSLRQGRP